MDVSVDDAPFLAVEMEVRNPGPDQNLVFRTNVDDVGDGRRHPLRFETEAGSGGLKPYLRVRGRLEALVTRALYYDLVALAEPATIDGREVLCLESGGARFRLEPDTERATWPRAWRVCCHIILDTKTSTRSVPALLALPVLRALSRRPADLQVTRHPQLAPNDPAKTE